MPETQPPDPAWVAEAEELGFDVEAFDMYSDDSWAYHDEYVGHMHGLEVDSGAADV
jgi:hypothetical protein